MEHIAMLSREAELTVITSTDDPYFLKDIDGNIKVIPMAIERHVSPVNDFKNLVQLFFIFRRERYDLIHSLSPKTGLLGMIAAWLARTPLRVHTFQGEVWITRTGLWRNILKALDTLMAHCANHLLVVSRSEEDFLVQQGVVSAGRLKILANGSICGVDVARFRPDSDARAQVRSQLDIPTSDRVIIYVGRFNIDKGLLDLAQAFVNISSVYPNTHLLLVGPDEENIRPKIEGICAAANRVHFVGYTAEPERYMAASDLLCLPSYREGFGMVLLEAAAIGLPTIGSRIYGISDAMVDGKTGLLFDVANVDDLTAKLICLLDDPLLAGRLGMAGQTRARRDFDSHRVSSALLDYYRALLGSYESKSS
jgi:glycosyltransferase involved in cell wall biosynthesis